MRKKSDSKQPEERLLPGQQPQERVPASSGDASVREQWRTQGSILLSFLLLPPLPSPCELNRREWWTPASSGDGSGALVAGSGDLPTGSAAWCGNQPAVVFPAGSRRTDVRGLGAAGLGRRRKP